MKIKEISPEYRPRERLAKLGSSALSEAELLAIILQKGTFQENAIDMSHRLISKYGLGKLSNCSLTELQEIKGVGLAKACQILALFELQKRHKVSKSCKVIKSAKDVFDYCSPKIGDSKQEHLMVLFLDSRNQIIKDETLFIGTLNACVIHPREIFKSALRESADSIIIVHNHPSGDCTPSTEDKEITFQLRTAGELLKIKVLDHVIVSNDKWFSFEE